MGGPAIMGGPPIMDGIMPGIPIGGPPIMPGGGMPPGGGPPIMPGGGGPPPGGGPPHIASSEMRESSAERPSYRARPVQQLSQR